MSSDPCRSDAQPPPRTAADSESLLRALLAHAVDVSGAEYGAILLTGSMQRLLLAEGVDARFGPRGVAQGAGDAARGGARDPRASTSSPDAFRSLEWDSRPPDAPAARPPPCP